MRNKLIIDVDILSKNRITPYQYILLYCLYYKNFNYITSFLTKSDVKEVRNSLIGTKYILSDNDNIKVPDTIISKLEVEKLLGLHVDKINFDEWYHTYPIKVGSRILRAVSDTSILYKKHKEKYLKKIKTKDQHSKAIAATEAFINSQKQANKLQFLPNIETVLNNATWESWEAFVESKGEEGKVWNLKGI